MYRPATHSAKTSKDFNRSGRATEKAETAQITLSSCVFFFFFKVRGGAVRNRVSSSNSQANATQSAVDEGRCVCIAPRASADDDDLVIF